MAEFSKLIITKKGQALIAKILTGENTVEFTRIASSGNSYELDQLEELTVLENIKQSSLISSITKTNETAIKAEASFTNTDITEGYYMRALGLYSIDPEEGEVLYAVTVETSGNCYMPPYNGVTVSGAYIQLVTSVGNAENVSLEIDPAAIATIGNIQDLKTKMEEEFALHEVRFTKLDNHEAAKDNPHQVTKEQIGLGEVDNTNDMNKPVSTATQEAIQEVRSSNKQYVDSKVAELVNGAPEALDTLLELANAFTSNQELVNTLTDAIGKKANQADLTNHQNNTTLHITAAERNKWNTVDTALSPTSTNPIQNKVVKAALDQQNVKNSGFESSIGELNSNLGGNRLITEGSGANAKYYIQTGADAASKKLLGSNINHILYKQESFGRPDATTTYNNSFTVEQDCSMEVMIWSYSNGGHVVGITLSRNNVAVSGYNIVAMAVCNIKKYTFLAKKNDAIKMSFQRIYSGSDGYVSYII